MKTGEQQNKQYRLQLLYNARILEHNTATVKLNKQHLYYYTV